MKALFIALSVFLPGRALALQESASYPDLAVGSMVASLLLVLLCIVVFAYLMKKTNLLNTSKRRTLIKVVATLPLTNKGRVQMIEINGQQYLLGVTEQNISLLDKLDKPLVVETTAATATPFATLLSKISHKTDE